VYFIKKFHLNSKESSQEFKTEAEARAEFKRLNGRDSFVSYILVIDGILFGATFKDSRGRVAYQCDY
jgi:hypothetical protein